jgi:hypothetical protein
MSDNLTPGTCRRPRRAYELNASMTVVWDRATISSHKPEAMHCWAWWRVGVLGNWEIT